MTIAQTPRAKIFERVTRDRRIRTAVTRSSHEWFFAVYFPHYLIFGTAPFQREIFALTEDTAWKLFCLVAFRGSGKSTIITLSYALWAILGIQQIRFVLIICQTRGQAKQHMMNLKRELEANVLLKNDLGPFQEEDDEWGSSSLVFSRYNARITVASTEQSIRGLRHHQHRPGLIICDDVEDLASVKTKEGRDKAYQWFNGEAIPAGDVGTRTIVVGNLLHKDCLIMRLKRDIEERRINGIFRAYPLLDAEERCFWPGKFRTQADITELRRKVGMESAWRREYLLQLVPEEDQLIPDEWIHCYDDLPAGNADFVETITGVDLAIAKHQSADYTAMISGRIYGYGEDMKIYILPHPVNERLDFPATRERIKSLSRSLGSGYPTRVFIEDVSYQKSIIQDLRQEGYPVEGFPIHGQDKYARLKLITHMIQSGRVLFPRHGADELIQQLVGFGIEKHDDLADALAILVLQTLREPPGRPEIIILG